jgi:hypothetical protein
MATQNINAIKVNKITALHDDVIVEEMVFGERSLSGGLILLNDDGKGYGIRPRWGKIYAVGPKQKDVVPGQWIMVAHGRWSRGYLIEDANGQTTIRKVDPSDMLIVSDVDPGNDDTMSDSVSIDSNSMPESSKFYKGD